MLSSATHGVEGYCGSGAQVALLHDDGVVEAIEDSGAAVLFVHALNPYGFSHLRRANEDNVDLNRNFRDHAEPAPANAGYAELHPLLLPESWPPPVPNEDRIAAWAARHGEKALQAAMTRGQYSHPDGLFFGGVRATWSNRTLRDILRRHAAAARRIGWIDFHTGLGPSGHGEKIFAARDDAAALARTRAWWGPDVTSFYDGSSNSAALTGVLFNAVYEECPAAEYTGIALEFGTLPLPDVLLALRAEAWLHRHPEAPDRLATAIRQPDARRLLRRHRRLEGAGGTPVARRHAPRAGRAAVSAPLPLVAVPSWRARIAAAWDGDVGSASGARPWRSSRPSCSRSASSARCSRRGSRRTTRSTCGRSTCSTRSRRRRGSRAATRSYLLGTDDQGRDVLSAIMFGARISLLVGLASVALAVVVGVSLGLVAGYVGGRLDAFIMRVADVQLSFPAILIALLIDGVARAVAAARCALERRAARADLRDRASRTGCSTRAPCAARRWSRRTRSTSRRRG